ncbi:protein of unknown function DUF697 [Kipferlia bialata]|uniref:G domain-containing protein n=1 Tax=Kipferlia bialata TaxID=797122 RepID=A0A391NTQ0_9EUKA|nr:protein of unknown function DUF697 [Kipferlia bialata]|eukprot:g9641.t1
MPVDQAAPLEDGPEYDEVAEELRRLHNSFDKTLGRVNVIVAGMTGAGKSTLLNSMFGTSLAGVSHDGRPMTTETELYVHPSGHLGIYDTKGFELGEKVQDEVMKLINMRKTKMKHVKSAPHVLWYCVNSATKACDTELNFIRRVVKTGMPVVTVITRAHDFGRGVLSDKVLMQQTLQRELPESVPVLLVDSISSVEMGTQAHGLTTLLNTTAPLIDKGARNALIVMQRIDQKQKRILARATVLTAATAAGAVGAIPIPFLDAFLIAPTQVGMLAAIGGIYQVQFSKAAMTSVIACLTTTLGGRMAASELLKLIPVVGSAVCAGTGFVITAATGFAWEAVCQAYLQTGREMTDQEMIRLFKARLTSFLKLVSANREALMEEGEAFEEPERADPFAEEVLPMIELGGAESMLEPNLLDNDLVDDWEKMKAVYMRSKH